jgi:hypothetical protein
MADDIEGVGSGQQEQGMCEGKWDK